MSQRQISRRDFIRGAVGTGAALAAGSAGLSMLAGCKKETKIPLRVVSTEGDPKSIEIATAIVDRYMKNNPNVEISFENVPSDELMEKGMAAGAAKQDFGVQLAWASSAGELAAAGLLAGVDDVIDRVGRDDFFDASLLKAKNQVFCLPYFMTATVLYYRKDLFEEKGVEPPVTWDDHRRLCELFTEDTDGDGSVDRWGFTLPFGQRSSTGGTLLSWLKSNGGYLLDENGEVVWDSPQNIETIDFIKSLLPYCPPGWTEAGWGEEISHFYTGASAMSRYGGRLLSRTKEFNEEVYQATGGVRMPTPNGLPEEQVALVEVAGISIWKQAADLEVAKDFSYDFITGENYVDWVHTVVPHYLPPRHSVMNDAKYWDHPILQEKRDIVQHLLDSLDSGTNYMFEHGYYDPDANHIASSTLIFDCVQEICINEAPIKETMQKYAQKMRELIGQA